MAIYRHKQARRRGAIIPLTAIMLVAIMAFLAFALDLGYIVMVRSQLQNAADAATLAGTSQFWNKDLLKGSPTWSTVTPTICANASAQAQLFASKNYGGGVALTVSGNPDNSPSGDLVCGHIANINDPSCPMTYQTYPYNSLKITVRRDEISNGSVSLFFARALGLSSFQVQASATASCAMNVTGFKIQYPGTTTCKLLPFALDINVWNDVLAGNGPDDWSHNATTGAVSAGGDGIPECKLYPLSNGDGSGNAPSGDGLPPGNFGTLDIGVANNSTEDIERQIHYGPSASDLAHYANGELRLSESTSPPSIVLEGDTGVSAAFKDDLLAIKGEARIIPLYSQVSGPGNNARYTIVGFAGVTITDVVLTGSLADKHLTIQPCFCIDGNALAGNGTSGTSWYVSRPVTLSR